MTIREILEALPVSHEDALKVRLAARVDAPPDVLAALARDPSVTVRATVAMNDGAPLDARTALARDGDERIRVILAHQLANVLPALAGADRERLHADVAVTLTQLVVDEGARVRAAIAEAVKDMPDVPRDLILKLARDGAAEVCEPVLRLSPLLSAEDLLGLLSEPASHATVTAIARRPALQESVCDAIASSSDTQAIQAMLENQGAAIREATLDALIERAAGQGAWHEPLVRRPALNARAATALSQIVATHQLGILADRTDLAPETRRHLRRRLAERLGPAPKTHVEDLTLDEAMAEARVMFEEDQLTEAALLEAAGRGDHLLAMAMLAVAADVPVELVERATTLRTAKGLVSLAWKAGFSMRTAVTLQALLAHIAPPAILRPGGAGGFPLAADEMRWQLDFLAKTGR